MENERIPEEVARPQPKKRTSFRRAALVAAGLAFGGEHAEAQPIVPSDTAHATEVQKTASEKAAEQKEALRARLESFRWVTGITSDLAYTKPDELYTNTFTPEFIDWILAFEFADAQAREEVLGIGVPDLAHAILESAPPSEKFNSLFQVAELRYRIENGKYATIQKEMSKGDAERYIQLLKDTRTEREP
ncbi:MAG: hypothetical protein HYV34_03880 [Candidatus Kerfeldbacteria bacterium]|nr:hypothetical protein [Candidatus Kerfeldbacteria bacterium]